jgi:dCMP deaminase
MQISMKKGERQRPSWDEEFMFSAISWAAKSSCAHFQTGAVIVKENRAISSGYNGAPPGIENCLKVGCRKDREHVDFKEKGRGVCRGNHAEINAMNQIARADLKGTSLYTVYYPCSGCAKAIVGNGIREVIYSKIYEEPDCLTEELFKEAGIKMRRLDIDIEKYFNIIRAVYKK